MILRKTQPLMSILNSSLVDMPSPSNISYLWNFGSLLGLCLSTQIISGLLISMHYSNSTDTAFNSISHITRNVNNGWMMRAIHANMASMFFGLVYMHISRGLFYSSFSLKTTWLSGVIMLFLLMASAFLGYVLPWGQMSFWGATVITNLLSAIPYVGTNVTYWIWGGFSIDNATLTRFFSLHFMTPFILMSVMIVHIMFLHETGSNNPLGNPKNIDKIPLHPYFTWKDIFGVLITMTVLVNLIMLWPYKLSDPDNFTPANPLITPPHIQPEWYFLFAYAILRSVPNKLGGVIALFLAITILISLSFSMKNKFNPMSMYPLNKMLFWSFINTVMLLTHLGASPVESPYTGLSQILTIFYFSYFVTMPLTTKPK